MDIFGDDIDSFYHNNDDLNENIRDGNDIEEAEEDNGEKEGDGDGKLDENGEPIKVEAKKRSVRRPQVTFKYFSIEKQWNSNQKNFFIEIDFSCV